MLYRVFPWSEDAAPAEPGGPLYVARARQGAGRHDQPERFGALYLSRSPESAIAENIQAFRGRTITNAHLVIAGLPLALAEIDDASIGELIDLDDPKVLVKRRLRPSRIATRERQTTQRIAADAFEEGAPGVSWWSTIESSWINVTLFAERVRLDVVGTPSALTIETAIVREVATLIGVGLGV